MFKDFRRLSLAQRRLVFFLIFGGGIVLIVAITALLVASSLNTGARQMAVALIDDVSVRQFAALPDNDAFPSSVAVAPDGTVYTGSYATGAIYRIDPAGSVTEVPGTREAIGAAFGMVIAPDGGLLVIDQVDTDPRSAGGALARVPLNGGSVDPFYALPDNGFVSPQDVAVDGTGTIYVSDSGLNQIIKFDANGMNGAVWWVPPTQPGSLAISGLAYDASTDSLLVTEPEQNIIYRVRVSDGMTTELYRHPVGAQYPPGFNGITITPDGTVYVAALGQNGIILLDPAAATGETPQDALQYIVGAFRGASDVAFDGERNRLVVTNFDQSSLVLPVVQPQLPFALDVIELQPPDAQGV